MRNVALALPVKMARIPAKEELLGQPEGVGAMLAPQFHFGNR